MILYIKKLFKTIFPSKRQTPGQQKPCQLAKTLEITGIGSCLTEMVTGYLDRQLVSQSSQQRSDVVADFTRGIFPDKDIISRYLTVGKWPENKAEYAQWFTAYTLKKIASSQQIIHDTPDILILDSLCDIYHHLYEHREKGFKALIGNIAFDDEATQKAFDNEFKFIGLLTPEQIRDNLRIIFDFFLDKNPALQIFYMHFPFAKEYLEPKWLERADALHEVLTPLHQEYHNGFTEISIPPEQIKPITDPADPHYSPKIWNHFYPEVYQYFMLEIIKNTNC